MFFTKPQHLLHLILLLTLSVSVRAEAPLRVLSSITPLQLIAGEVLTNVGTAEVLLPAGASPHQYALRPSEVRNIQDADIVIWVGPSLERFLMKPLQQTPAQVITLLPEDPAAHSDEQHSEHGHEDDEHHHHGGIDPHIWLSPAHALEIAEQIVQQAIKLRPQAKAQLEKNLLSFALALAEQDQQLMARFSALSEAGFMTFHDAYGHFVKHYHLNQLGSFTVNPSRKPGARRLAELRQTLADSGARCVFSEPQFSAAIIQSVTKGMAVNVTELDPLGQAFSPAPGAYLAFLGTFGEKIAECLKNPQ